MAIETRRLEDVVRQYVLLDNENSKGWCACLHLGCDHGKKGNRAAFNFTQDVVAFHCFNCGVSTTYDPNSHDKIPTKMHQVLMDFNIPDTEYKSVMLNGWIKIRQGNNKHDINTTTTDIEPITISQPQTFYTLNTAKPSDVWAEIANDYLLHNRKIDPTKYNFMLSKKLPAKYHDKWHQRLIIPVYKNNKLIFYQGRDLVGNKTKKYESPSTEKDKILSNFDRLFEYTDNPLYVVEGWFDAESIDGVAIFGNKLTDAQILWLDRSRRPKVYIPDKLGDGIYAGKQALKCGWKISTPNVPGCKDMNDAVIKYGKLYVLKSLVENTASGFKAEVQLGMYCK